MLTFFNWGIIGGISFLGLLIFFRSPRNIVNRLFLALSSAAVIWISAVHLLNQAVDNEVALLWARTAMVGPILFFLTLAEFSKVFPRQAPASRTAFEYVTLLFGFFLLLLSPTSLNVASVSVMREGVPDVETGPLYVLTGLFIAFSLFVIGRNFAQQSNQAGATEKKQLKILLLGVVLTVIFSIITNLVLVLLELKTYARFGPLSTGFMLAATAYAIARYNIFNVKVVLAELAVAALIILNFAEVLSAREAAEVISRLVILTLVSLAGVLFVRSVQNEVRRREEVEELAKEKTKALAELEQRNKNLATLQKISRLVLDEIELKPMAQKILDEIPRELENCRGALLNLVKGGQLGAYAISSTDITEKIYRMVGADISKYSYPLKSGFNLLHDAILTKQAKESPRLSDFISPPIPKALALHGGTQVQLV